MASEVTLSTSRSAEFSTRFLDFSISRNREIEKSRGPGEQTNRGSVGRPSREIEESRNRTGLGEQTRWRLRVWVDSIGASVEKSRNLEIERPRGADKSGVWVDSFDIENRRILDSIEIEKSSRVETGTSIANGQNLEVEIHQKFRSEQCRESKCTLATYHVSVDLCY